MFMGLEGPFETGARFPATLIFEQAGEVAVEFVVEQRPGAGANEGMEHGDMMEHGDIDQEDVETPSAE